MSEEKVKDPEAESAASDASLSSGAGEERDQPERSVPDPVDPPIQNT